MPEQFGRWFLPGAAEVHPEVLAAMRGSDDGLDAPGIVAGLQPPLQDLFRTTREVRIVASSATGLMEAAIRSGVRERVLAVIGGSYGERFAQVAESCGKEVVRAHVPPGRTLEAEHLAQFLDGPEVDAVALVHSETSTGALTPLAELARVVQARENIHLLVDAAGSIGGTPVETDLWGLDFVFTGSQKALALPPGLAFGVVSSRLLERASTLSGRGQYLDLVHLCRPSVPGVGPAGSLLPQYRALSAQMDRITRAGGTEARWARHHEMLKMIEEWVLLRPGFEFLVPEGRRAWTVSWIRLPAGVTSAHVVGAMEDRGWRIERGFSETQGQAVRIGHMGDVTPHHLGRLLADLDLVITGNPAPAV